MSSVSLNLFKPTLGDGPNKPNQNGTMIGVALTSV